MDGATYGFEDLLLAQIVWRHLFIAAAAAERVEAAETHGGGYVGFGRWRGRDSSRRRGLKFWNGAKKWVLRSALHCDWIAHSRVWERARESKVEQREYSALSSRSTHSPPLCQRATGSGSTSHRR